MWWRLRTRIRFTARHGRRWAGLLDPLTQDACAFYEDHGLFDDYTGVVYDVPEGDRIGVALANYKAVILQNHGLLTVGKTVDEAAGHFHLRWSAAASRSLWQKRWESLS